MSNVLIVVPARLASSRLPRKMLADIGGEALIVRTYKAAVSAKVGDVIVACDHEEIADLIKKAGGQSIITDPNLQSGTDRIFAAYSLLNKKYDFIINVQGDAPFVNSRFITSTVNILKNHSDVDMSTVAVPILDEAYKIDSVVKPVISFEDRNYGKALYFSRSPIPFGGPYYHHIGIYGFTNDSLEKFVSLQPHNLEKLEKLEQLRALGNGMTIGIEVIDEVAPISIDTENDLIAARKYFESTESA